ncbi:hypothetical protein [Legionella worsleiensis]|uniref:Uncharacterized protein n=1 Tax=Legionella worsleiensis TaxID=45076 RepID=A0A0W1A6D9_9GAMM|nr:hypothetical protein [Legionella worsleiensis]KTD76907.1 hypothetical protein Lwor_2132 [Legionella worsleiensis]STY33423.1 Uncharacterised protein [Legionella worsleiensis]
MPSIFASKDLLDKEYKRLFLDRLSSVTKFKDCLAARYDKTSITDFELQDLFLDYHSKINEFIGTKNESRIVHFFGDFTRNDTRDTQIRRIDKLVLDSIHFEITGTLLTQFIAEYNENQEAIDQEWSSEINVDTDDDLDIKKALIQNAISSNKDRVFNDLIFPETNETISLFDCDGERIIPDPNVFKNWLRQPEAQKTKTVPNNMHAIAEDMPKYQPKKKSELLTNGSVFAFAFLSIIALSCAFILSGGSIIFAAPLPVLLVMMIPWICDEANGKNQQKKSEERLANSSTGMMLGSLPCNASKAMSKPQPPASGSKELFVRNDQKAEHDNTQTQSEQLRPG